MKLGEVSNALAIKGWMFNSSLPETDTAYSKVVWAFKKSEISDGKASGWFSFISSRGNYNRIIYQVHNVRSYNLVLADLGSLGFKMSSSEVKDDMITSVYKNKLNVITITAAADSDETFATYILSLYALKDYLTIELSREFTRLNKLQAENAPDLYITSINTEDVPLRMTPNIDSKVIYYVPRIALIHVKRRGEIYYKVSVDGYSGYISQTYLVER